MASYHLCHDRSILLIAFVWMWSQISWTKGTANFTGYHCCQYLDGESERHWSILRKKLVSTIAWIVKKRSHSCFSLLNAFACKSQRVMHKPFSPSGTAVLNIYFESLWQHWLDSDFLDWSSAQLEEPVKSSSAYLLAIARYLWRGQPVSSPSNIS